MCATGGGSAHPKFSESSSTDAKPDAAAFAAAPVEKEPAAVPAAVAPADGPMTWRAYLSSWNNIEHVLQRRRPAASEAHVAGVLLRLCRRLSKALWQHGVVGANELVVRGRLGVARARVRVARGVQIAGRGTIHRVYDWSMGMHVGMPPALHTDTSGEWSTWLESHHRSGCSVVARACQ